MKTKKTTKKEDSQEFAVIATGGKQYKVSVGDVLEIEKLPKKPEQGSKILFDKVLLVDNGSDTTIGSPYIDGAVVEAIYQGDKRLQKIDVIKYKAKSRYYKKYGHRQPQSVVKISAIK